MPNDTQRCCFNGILRFQVSVSTCCCFARFDSRHVVWLSSRVVACCRATHGLLAYGPVYGVCPCWDTRGCSCIQGDANTKRQPFTCWVESCCSVMVSSVFVVVVAGEKRSCATVNTYARLEAVSRTHSQSSRSFHSYHLYHSFHPGFAPKFLRVLGCSLCNS